MGRSNRWPQWEISDGWPLHNKHFGFSPSPMTKSSSVTGACHSQTTSEGFWGYQVLSNRATEGVFKAHQIIFICSAEPMQIIYGSCYVSKVEELSHNTAFILIHSSNEILRACLSPPFKGYFHRFRNATHISFGSRGVFSPWFPRNQSTALCECG